MDTGTKDKSDHDSGPGIQIDSTQSMDLTGNCPKAHNICFAKNTFGPTSLIPRGEASNTKQASAHREYTNSGKRRLSSDSSISFVGELIVNAAGKGRVVREQGLQCVGEVSKQDAFDEVAEWSPFASQAERYDTVLNIKKPAYECSSVEHGQVCCDKLSETAGRINRRTVLNQCGEVAPHHISNPGSYTIEQKSSQDDLGSTEQNESSVIFQRRSTAGKSSAPEEEIVSIGEVVTCPGGNGRALAAECSIQLSQTSTIMYDTMITNKSLSKRKSFAEILNVPGAAGDDTRLTMQGDGNDEHIIISPRLCQHLKPHQIEGVRFMFKTLIGNREKYRRTTGNGAVLAHVMGLGKTLQVITLLDAVYRLIGKEMSTLLLIPVNVIDHWKLEFSRWLPLEHRPDGLRRIYSLDSTTALSRLKLIQSWEQSKGILLMGYELFRSLVRIPDGRLKKPDPGANTIGHVLITNSDIVICDEGHRIKNRKSAIAMSLKRLRTKRRLVLTGTPMQNNLSEYYCMIDFVQPGLLGSQEDFDYNFRHPIDNGSCADSTPLDVEVMMKSTYLLQQIVRRTVQRCGYDAIRSHLPEFTETVLTIKMTDLQWRLSVNLFNVMNNLVSMSKSRSINPLLMYLLHRKIFTHPLCFLSMIKDDHKVRSTDAVQPQYVHRRSVKLIDVLIDKTWKEYIPTNKIVETYDMCPKMLIMRRLLEEIIVRGEKCLIFSQSITTLNWVEAYLSTTWESFEVPNAGPRQWVEGLSYWRMDGKTTVLERSRKMKLFNEDVPTGQTNFPKYPVFLISTKAGGIGVNLSAASRVILFDVSWNPSLDEQAISRVFRFGQTKPCHVYRLVTGCSMEERVLKRQIKKLSMSRRVVDSCNVRRKLTKKEVRDLYAMDDINNATTSVGELRLGEAMKICRDGVLKALCQSTGAELFSVPYEIDSLLTVDPCSALSEEDKREIMKKYKSKNNRKRTHANALGSTARRDALTTSVNIISTKNSKGYRGRHAGTSCNASRDTEEVEQLKSAVSNLRDRGIIAWLERAGIDGATHDNGFVIHNDSLIRLSDNGVLVETVRKVTDVEKTNAIHCLQTGRPVKLGVKIIPSPPSEIKHVDTMLKSPSWTEQQPGERSRQKHTLVVASTDAYQIDSDASSLSSQYEVDA